MIFFTLLYILLALLVMKIIQSYEKIKRWKQISGNIPGPTPIPIFGNLFSVGTNPHDVYKNTVKYTKQYGPTTAIWVGTNLQVYISYKEDVKTILSSNVLTAKGYMYKLMADLFGTSFFITDGDFSKKNRKIILPTLRTSMIIGYLDVFNHNYKIMTDLMEKEVGNDGFNMETYLRNCTIDNIFETTLETKLHSQTSLNKAADSFHGIPRMLALRLYTVWLHSDTLFRLSSLGRKFFKSLKFLEDIVSEEINKKKIRTKEKLLDYNLENKELETMSKKSFIDLMVDPNSFMTDDQIRSEAITLIQAGHGTITDTSCFIVYELARNQDMQNKAFEEINLYFGDDKRDPTYEDLQQLSYIERFINETMRLHPFSYFARYVKQDTVLHNGYTLPAGSTVCIDSVHLHKDPEEFPYPDTFNPDNFLPEHCARRHPYAYVPFSAGPRRCIGMKYGMLSMKCGMVHLLRKYRFLPSDTLPDIKMGFEILTRSINGVNVRIEKRSHLNT